MEYQSYDSLEAMFEAMEKQRTIADMFTKPFQRAVDPGDYYTQTASDGLTIYGKILKDPEQRAPQFKNYRFVEAYSVACPEGELGDIHVAGITRIITCDEFLHAQDLGWQV